MTRLTRDLSLPSDPILGLHRRAPKRLLKIDARSGLALQVLAALARLDNLRRTGIDTCVDMCVDMCVGMCVDTCVDTCVGMCRYVYGHVCRPVAKRVYRHVQA